MILRMASDRAATVAEKSGYQRFLALLEQHLWLFGALQLPSVFAALIVSLPLTAYAGAPLHELLGGVFAGNTPWQVFFSSVAFVASSISWIIVTSLLVEGQEARRSTDFRHAYRDEEGRRRGPVCQPAWSYHVFRLPLTRVGLLVPLVLAFPGLYTVVATADGVRAYAALAGLLGALVPYLLLLAGLGALELVDPGYHALPRGFFARLGSVLSRLAAQRLWVAFYRWLRVVMTRILKETPFDEVIDERTGLLHLDHLFAAAALFSFLVIFALEAWLFAPARPVLTDVPTASLLFTFLTLLIWLLGAIAFYAGRFAISWLFVFGLLTVLSFVAFSRDHEYQVTLHPASSVPAGERIDSAELVRTVGDGNLVVLTSTGGGILAAGWTTLALEHLFTVRRELAQELRLVSAVSGGSVGTAFALAALHQAPQHARIPEVLHDAHQRSVVSSLSAVGYGLVFHDFLGVISGGLFTHVRGGDRGERLDNALREHANDRVGLHLVNLVADIRAGKLPAPIFNTTVMENGRRVLITPIDLAGPAQRGRGLVPDAAGEEVRSPRAQTLDEYLSPKHSQVADISLWTAARLSATFPYVTPAARSSLREGPATTRHHLLDGGYYDNYGVASLLDWLEPVLAARFQEREGYTFRRLLVIQLRAQPAVDPLDTRGMGALSSAFVGPLVGVLNIRDGAALTRNETELHRFLTAWQNRLAGEVELATVVFQPQDNLENPLSWHLTSRELAQLRGRWPDDPSHKPNISGPLTCMRAFLADTPLPDACKCEPAWQLAARFQVRCPRP
jgi:hypothetical protein